MLTIQTMTVIILQSGTNYKLTFQQDGASVTVCLQIRPEASRYSFDCENGEDGPADPATPVLSFSEPSSAKPPEIQATTFWWDGVRFVKGWPYVYPHPDRSYYSILAKYDWARNGYQLYHRQFGTDAVNTWGRLGPVVIAAVIGALVGAIIGGPVGGAIGAVVGAVVGAVFAIILTYVYNVLWQDEAGAIWFWVNKSLFTALQNIPWWVWLCWTVCGPAYVWENTDYVRVGSATFLNYLGIADP